MILLLVLLAFQILAVAANPIKHARTALFGRRGTAQQDFLVTSLPGLTKNIPEHDIPLMFAGQLELYANNDTHYFFWKFSDRHKSAEAQNKTIFWLNGGPGCSSMDGALMEAGPLRVNGQAEVVYNEGSWHKKGDIIFVDQPAGTGFSYGQEYDSDLAGVLWHFLTFLEKYFALFPEDAENEIILAGESYAGQYIPYIAQAIHDRNLRVEKDNVPKFNLRGLLIGNGYIAPNEQGLSYVPFAVQAGLVKTSDPYWQKLLELHERCQRAVDKSHAEKSLSAYAIVNKDCDRVLTVLLLLTRDLLAAEDQQCVNMYDYTLRDSYPSCGMNWPPDLPDVSKFLRDDKVMGDLNLIAHKRWNECLGLVLNHLRAKLSMPSITLFPELLQHTEIVLFHGNRDIICNYLGAEGMIKKLKWSGHEGFTSDAPVYDWRHDGSVLGYVQMEHNLTYVNVFDASHMVPFDKPELSTALVDVLYKRYDLKHPKDEKPALVTHLMASTTDDNSGASGTEKESESSGAVENDQQTSRVVRVIQLAVIVVIVWGICALYATYKSKPTSIIKTKSTGRKKNVQWADQLEEDAPDKKDGSFFKKAINKFTKSESAYLPLGEDAIEMEHQKASDDDFIIGSDEELEHHR